ncbi:PQ loop repeat protein [Entamoeba histolytica]
MTIPKIVSIIILIIPTVLSNGIKYCEATGSESDQFWYINYLNTFEIILGIVILVFTIISVLPQAIKIIRRKNGEGLSPTYLLLMTCNQVFAGVNSTILNYPTMASCPYIGARKCECNPFTDWFAYVFGICSSIVTFVEYLPQIWRTFRTKNCGSLSLTANSIQTLGCFVIVCYMFFSTQQHITTLATYIVSFIQHTVLVVLQIKYDYIDKYCCKKKGSGYNDFNVEEMKENKETGSTRKNELYHQLISQNKEKEIVIEPVKEGINEICNEIEIEDEQIKNRNSDETENELEQAVMVDS